MRRVLRKWLLISLALGCAVTFMTPCRAAEPVPVKLGHLIMEGIPEIPPAVGRRLSAYQSSRSASLQGWDPAGKGLFISTRFGQTSQLHRVRTPLGARQQITFFDEPVRSAAVSPDPAVAGLIFQRDVGGGEFYQLFFLDLTTGRTRLLTDGQSRNGGIVWSRDGGRFAYYTTRRNGRDWDIQVGTIARPGETRPVLEKSGTWFPADWSPDGTKLLVQKYVSAAESHPFILDLASGDLTSLESDSESHRKVAYGGLAFSADGGSVYLTSDGDGLFKRLRHLDLASRRQESLSDDIPWDVQEFTLSRDGHFLAFTVNADGYARLHVKDLARGREMNLPVLPPGQISGMRFDAQSRNLGLVVNTPQTPGDVYSLALSGGSLTRWTESETGGLVAERFSLPSLIRFPTFDAIEGNRRMVPAFYYRPRGNGPFPVLIQIHGGPEGQARPFFNPVLQYWVNELGLAVLVPNVRGSAGYGKAYRELDNGRRREDSVRDIGALLDWVHTQPELDGNRMGVIGGSYGGYMSLACMVRFNAQLKAGIDIVGISNFVTFLENTKAYRRDLRRVEYGDERNHDMRAFLNKISPANHADAIRSPLLIVSGQNDPRVPASEGAQMAGVIRENGGTVWTLLATDEGHGFRKKRNRDFYNSVVSVFLQKFLIHPQASGTGRGGQEPVARRMKEFSGVGEARCGETGDKKERLGSRVRSAAQPGRMSMRADHRVQEAGYACFREIQG